MELQTVTIKLPTSLLLIAQDVATQRNETIAKVIEDLLERDLSGRPMPKQTETINQKLVFALQSLLFADMAAAASWSDLTERLARHGYWLKMSWGGLTLHTRTSGLRLCHSTELGFGYRTFLRRFGPGLPGHPHEISEDDAGDDALPAEEAEVETRRIDRMASPDKEQPELRA